MFFTSAPTPSRRSAAALASALLLAGAAGNARANIDIVFDYTNAPATFYTNQVKALMDAAALAFESRITDNLTAITSGGSDSFNAQYFNPNDPNLNAPDITVNNFSVAANTVVIFMGASNLGGSTLGVGGPGGSSSGGSLAFLNNAKSRGQAGALLPAATATDFGPWGGSIGFSTTAQWYFDPNVSTFESFSGYDFYSVAVHEIAHVLGIGGAPTWKNHTLGTNFVGANVGTVALNGGKDHWAEGTMSIANGVAQEAAMDPTIAAGQRKYFTTLDYAGLQDIGWQISAVPEPATWLMWGVGGALLAGLRRRAANSK